MKGGENEAAYTPFQAACNNKTTERQRGKKNYRRKRAHRLTFLRFAARPSCRKF
jgi:hypothetical protein